MKKNKIYFLAATLLILFSCNEILVEESVKNGYYISGAFDARLNSSETAGIGEIFLSTYSQEYGERYNYAYNIMMLPNVSK